MFFGAGLLTVKNLQEGTSPDFMDKNLKMPALKGNINHSACYWVYQKQFTVEQFCQEAKK